MQTWEARRLRQETSSFPVSSGSLSASLTSPVVNCPESLGGLVKQEEVHRKLMGCGYSDLMAKRAGYYHAIVARVSHGPFGATCYLHARRSQLLERLFLMSGPPRSVPVLIESLSALCPVRIRVPGCEL